MLILDYNYLVENFPDIIRRDNITIEWLKVQISQLATTHFNYRIEFERLYNLYSHNCTVSSLEHLINTNFSLSVPATIVDGYFFRNAYTVPSSQPYKQGKMVTRLISEVEKTTYTRMNNEKNTTSSFVIYIDSSDSGLSDSIMAFIKDFVKVGKKYEIKYY